MSKPSSSSQSAKQATLLGFFAKKPPAPPSGGAAPRPHTPVTPSTTDNGSDRASSSSDVKSKITSKNAKQPAVGAKSNGAPASTSSKSGTAMQHSIDLSSDGIDESAPLPYSSSTLKSKGKSNASSKLSQFKSKGPVSTPTPPINGNKIPTPPLTSEGEGDETGNGSASVTAASASEMEVDDEDMEGERISRRASGSRTTKRQIIESESEGESSGPPKKKQAPVKPGKKQSKQDSPLSLDTEDDDEDEFDEGVDWDAVAELSDAPPPKKAKAAAKIASKGKEKAVVKKPASGRPAATQKKSASNNFKTLADLGKEERQVEYSGAGENFAFLKEENIRDANKNRPDHPDFDPRTLYIPKSASDKFTPFETQFWDIKKKHMDTVLFFQKGKFFELYEQDADIGNQSFDLKLTGRVKMRMVGVPEASIDYWIAKFLAQGHKVGRVDQAETAMGADLRRQDEKSGKAKKFAASAGKSIVNRELKTVLTTGTIVDGHLLTDDLSNHCIAVKEYLLDGSQNPRFGIVIADCSTAEFTMSAFQDDACRTRLETTIRQHRPRELICEKGNLSVPTLRLLRACVGPSCSWNNLKAGDEFLSAEEAKQGIKALFAKAGNDEEEDGDIDMDASDDGVPEQIKEMYDNTEAMSAMGGMLWYLKGLNLDKDLFSVKNFNIFDPIRDGQSLILDGQTLAHIEVLQNSLGTDDGTLFKLLCRCSTPFGTRLFKIWVCQPLRQAKAINDRLDAVEDLMKFPYFNETFEKGTKGMPDLERLLSRIHAKSCRVKDFLKVLETFENLSTLVDNLLTATEDFKSSGISSLLRGAPDLESNIAEVRNMFKVEDGELKPLPNIDEEYDAVADKVDAIEERLEDELKKYKKELKDPKLEFKDIGTKDIYQIQVSVKTKVHKNWTKISGTQAVNRYYSPEVAKLVHNLKEARERRDQASKVFQYTVFERFSEDYHTWLKAVKLIAEVDCLVSLAKSSIALGDPAIRPEIIEAPQAFVDFEELRHPCVFNVGADFIPNDVRLGGEEKKMVLLTGPNMAGKSTLLRMSCVGLILAQIGCYVPAKSARISPCDRIVSRMGASDNMLAGQSTFRVEMEDCRKILVESTPKTLVILDELGRGTSTFDGLSIAYAVLHQLAGHIGCIGFFATHFTSLVDEFETHPEIVLKHMKTYVDEDTRGVTFLYQLTDGCSPKSYGPHVASMAGVPRGIVERAIAVSKEFEDRTKAHEASKKKDQALPLDLQADASYLMKLAARESVTSDAQLLNILCLIREKVKIANRAKPATNASLEEMED